MIDSFDAPETAEEDVLSTITKLSVVETPFFDIHFKTYEHGDHAVDAAKGAIARDVFNALCDRLVILLATRTITTRKAVCGQEALADDTAPMFTELFNKDGSLKEEHQSLLDEAGIARAEGDWVYVKGCLETLLGLAAAREKFLPHAQSPLQFAWNAQAGKPIYNYKEAIQYRIESSASLRTIKAVVADTRRNQRGMNHDYSEVAAALEF